MFLMTLGIVLCFPVNCMSAFCMPSTLLLFWFGVCVCVCVCVCACVCAGMCMCSFFGCIEYTCHECTYPGPPFYSCDSLYLWTHILSYMFVLPIFASVRVFYLHHFLIPYCIFIVCASIWFCAREHRCACWCSVMCPSEYHLQESVLPIGYEGW